MLSVNFYSLHLQKALENMAEKMASQSADENVQTESCVISNDPAERRGIQLSEQEKKFLIPKGPHRPVLEKYPCNNAVSKTKQNSFSAKWYEAYPYLEYSPSLDRAYCFACSLFGDEVGSGCTAETKWSSANVGCQSLG